MCGAFARDIRMKLAGAALALTLMLVSTAMGAAATSNEGMIVFASGQPSYPPPANLNESRIYSISVDGRGRRNIGGTAGWGASLSPDGTKIAYWNDGLWVMNADGSSQRKVVSRGPQAGGEGPPALFDDGIAWSPDGTKLAFSGAVVDLDGNVVGSTGHDPAWSPDGKWIASVVDEGCYCNWDSEPEWQIVVSSLEGAASRELTQGVPIPYGAEPCWANPSWSPDGTRIAASLLNCGNEFDPVFLRSYLFPVGTGPPRVIVGATPPVWSPDGTKLAFLRQYAPEGYVERTTLYVARGDGSQARSLSVSAADPWGAPVWAPKGGRLAYASEQTGQIETIAVDGSGRRRVTHEPGDSVLTPFAWSADARRILYEAFVSPEHSHIWTMSPAGTGFKRLTRSRRDEGHPAWSPDGRQVAFTRWFAPNEHVSPIGAIYTIRPDGTHEKHLLGGPKAGYSASHPTWSPDGKRIAFVRISLDFEDTELFVADADGSHVRRIADAGDFDSYYSTPAWSPGGRRIAYTSGGMIVLVDPNSARKTRMTLNPAVVTDCDALAWSPDGRRFALACDDANTRTGPGGIYVMNIDGSDLHRVVDFGGVAASLTWSPNGTTIAFASVSCGPPGGFDAGICAIAADGSGLRSLTTPFRAPSSSPNWSTTRP